MVKDNQAATNQADLNGILPESDNTNLAGDVEFDPFSPESIAEEDEFQNNYISQIDSVYQDEEYSGAWAGTVEVEILSRLSDLDAFTQQSNPNRRPESRAIYASPDISVSHFNCRSQLCAIEVVSGSVDEMIAYQNYMVEQTKGDLPTIVFSTIEPYGNKFIMEAFLAREEYEFPQPKNRY